MKPAAKVNLTLLVAITEPVLNASAVVTTIMLTL